MKVKLEDLPVNTLIEIENCHDKVIKTEKYKWSVVGHECINCPLHMDERDGVDVEIPSDSRHVYIEVHKSLEEYFGKYTILSLPMAVVDTAIWLSNKLRNAPRETVIEDAIKYELMTEETNEEV